MFILFMFLNLFEDLFVVILYSLPSSSIILWFHYCECVSYSYFWNCTLVV